MRVSSRPSTVTSCFSQSPRFRRPSRDERVGRQCPRGAPDVDRVEVLDPAVGGERLQRRHTPVLGTLRRPHPEHDRRPGREVDSVVGGVPDVADVGRSPAGRERVPARQSTRPSPGETPASATAPDPPTIPAARPRPARPRRRSRALSTTDAQSTAAEGEHAEREGVAVLEQHRREADSDGHAGADERDPACARAQRGDERGGEGAEHHEAVQRRLLDRVERSAYRRRVVQRRPGPIQRGVRPRVEHDRQHGGGDEARQHGAPATVAGHRRHERERRGAGELPPRDRILEHRPGEPSRRRRRETAATIGRRPLTDIPGPVSRERLRERLALADDGERDPAAASRSSVGEAADGGRPAYVGASIATSALDRPTARRATSASATASGRAVMTTSSGTCARTPRAATRRCSGGPRAGSTPARASSAASQSCASPLTLWTCGVGAPITSTARRERAACARTSPAATRTASSRLDPPAGPATASASTSRRTATLSRGASSSSRTISSPRLADVGQCTARSGSPST